MFVRFRATPVDGVVGFYDLTISNHTLIRVGIMICMDREFPDVASDLVRDGVEIILVPNSCWLVDDPIVGDVRVGGVRSMAFEGALGSGPINWLEFALLS